MSRSSLNVSSGISDTDPILPKRGLRRRPNTEKFCNQISEAMHIILRDIDAKELTLDQFLDQLRGKIAIHPLVSNISLFVPSDFNKEQRGRYIISLLSRADSELAVENADNQKMCLLRLFYELKRTSQVKYSEQHTRVSIQEFQECINRAKVEPEPSLVVKNIRYRVYTP